MSESDKARARREAWEKKELAEFTRKAPESREKYETASGIKVHRIYTPEDEVPFDEIGLPGQHPFTRGPYPTMYRGRLWTMRQIAGFGTGEDTNVRFRYLIAQGQTGLSVDFDMPTLMGYDSDDPLSQGEVGREGVAIDTLDDMEALFQGIDLTKISVSMTINPTAWILLGMYVALSQSRGYDLNQLSGTVQADILKEYEAQKEWIFPIRPSMRIVRDLIVYCARNMKRYNPINISGYHISEAGANAVQELAFTMCNAIAYLDEVTKAGVPVDEFAPRLAFYFVSQQDFFEEIAKERYGAKNPESGRLRFHCQTAAATLTKPQPMNNIVRTARQALS
ncbi:MAG: methylmalonyl-CoA mutase family protein, partial [Myxococcales bacterium]